MKKKLISFVLLLLIILTIPPTNSIIVTAGTVNESEDNNSISTADIISTGNTINGSISDSNDIDYYKFTVNKNGYIEIDFSNIIQTNTSAQWDIVVYKYSNTLDEVHSQSISATTASTDLPRIGVSSGTYYIKIEDGYYNYGYVNNVEYNITVDFTATNYWESELNDTYITADKINTGSSYGGYLRNEDDNDYYEFTVTQNGYVEINFTNPILTKNNAKWTIVVYKYSNALDEVHSQSISATTASTDLPRIGVTPGTYYIKIIDGYYNYGYVDNIEYTIKVNFTATDCWESELNDTYITADKINTGSSYGGYLRNEDDNDYYEFTVTQNGYVEINFTNPVLTKNNAKWTIVVYKYSNALDEIHSQSISATVASTDLPRIGVTPGTYYIKIIDGYHNYGYVDNIEYAIKVDFTATNYWESELNDVYTTADEIILGQQYGGYLRNATDNDYYKINIDSSGYIDIRFANPVLTNSNANWKVVLYRYDNALTEVKSFVANGKNEITIESDIKVTEGVYYLKIIDGYYNYGYVNNIEYAITIAGDDKTKPTGSISSTNNVATSQTATLKLSDNVGVAGYYWGTSSTYSNNTYTSTSSTTITKTIESAGTYYLVVKDTSGNISSSYSITFYKTTLDTNSGTVSPAYIITESGKTITLPTPTNGDETFLGWGESTTDSNYVETIIVESSKTYYGIWEADVISVLGDVNNDGEVDAGDAVLISRYDAGLITLTEDQLKAGDVNSDGAVDAGDAVIISRYDAGFISSLI